MDIRTDGWTDGHTLWDHHPANLVARSRKIRPHVRNIARQRRAETGQVISLFFLSKVKTSLNEAQRPTMRPHDTISYRDARTHLKRHFPPEQLQNTTEGKGGHGFTSSGAHMHAPGHACMWARTYVCTHTRAHSRRMHTRAHTCGPCPTACMYAHTHTTDGPTDQRTDRRTYPLIEMRGRI